MVGWTDEARKFTLINAVIYIIIVPPILVLFLHRRTLFPIKGRLVSVIVSVNVIALLWVIYLGFSALYDAYVHCLIEYWVNFLFLVSILSMYLFRTFKLLFKFKIQFALQKIRSQQETPSGSILIHSSEDWFVQHRHYLDAKKIKKLIIFLCVFYLSLLAGLTIASYLSEPMENICTVAVLQEVRVLIVDIIASLYILILGVISFQMRNFVSDSFGLKREIQFASIFGVISIGGYIVSDYYSLTLYQAISLALSIWLIFLSSIVFPLMLNYKNSSQLNSWNEYLQKMRLKKAARKDKNKNESLDCSNPQSTPSTTPQASIMASNSAVSQEMKSLELQTLLDNPELLGSFQDFLAKEFSSENLDFYLTVQRYRNETVNKKLPEILQMSTEIYGQFIAESAMFQVNIDYRTRSKIKSDLNRVQAVIKFKEQMKQKHIERRESKKLKKKNIP